MGRRRLCAFIGSLLLVGVVGGSASASSSISATLDGTSITLREAASLSCHDFDYPILRCFISATAMELDVSRRLDHGLAAAVVLTTGYVTAYEHAGYAGSALTLSNDQAWLSSIGWNDRISSFKSFGAVGSFRENSPTGGFIYSFGPSTQVSFLSSTYNDKFSAFYIN